MTAYLTGYLHGIAAGSLSILLLSLSYKDTASNYYFEKITKPYIKSLFTLK